MGKKARPKKRKRGKPLPPCKALLLCEKTIIEQNTGNVTVIGIFTGFMVKQLPATISSFCVFMQVIDGIGRYEFWVEIHDLQNQTIIAKSPSMPITFSDRPNGGHIVIRVPPLPIKQPGAYDVVVMANGEEIQRQKFSVIIKPSAE